MLAVLFGRTAAESRQRHADLVGDLCGPGAHGAADSIIHHCPRRDARTADAGHAAVESQDRRLHIGTLRSPLVPTVS